MHLGCAHDVGAKVDQKVIVDQGSGSLAQAGTSERSCLSAVVAAAEGLGIGVGGGGSQECDDHV